VVRKTQGISGPPEEFLTSEGVFMEFGLVILSVINTNVKYGCPETSVRNYRYRLRNYPEERSSHLPSGSLKTRPSWNLDTIFRTSKGKAALYIT